MNIQRKQLLKHTILVQLEHYTPRSIVPSIIIQRINFEGHRINFEKLKEELDCLIEKKLISAHIQTTSSSTLEYRLSDFGREYLKAIGLI